MVMPSAVAARTDDDLLGWIGAAAALGAFARVAYLLFPSLYTEWLYAGDVLRLGMYLMLLVGCVREIRQYWRAQTVLAVAGERRRLARELHDGVVQELGFIRSQALRTPNSGDIASAADRALDEARGGLVGSDRAEPRHDEQHRHQRQSRIQQLAI